LRNQKVRQNFSFVKSRTNRLRKNGLEFFIGWRDSKYDTWEPITNLPGSENMIAEFNKKWEEDYKIKTVAALQSVIDKRNTVNK
jgi:hypothetical protein